MPFVELNEEMRKTKKYPDKMNFECEKHGSYVSDLCGYLPVMDKLGYSGCPSCDEERKSLEEKKKIVVDEEKKINDRNNLLLRGISKRFLEEEGQLRHTTFFNTHKKYLEFNDNNFLINKNMIILGGCGIGKSYFSYMLIKLAYKINKIYVCMKAKDLQSLFKSKTLSNGFTRTNSIDNLQPMLSEVDCLIIDEIDDIFGDMECFKQVVSYLYDECKRIIVIGNCNQEQLKDHIELKTYSRLQGGSVISGDFKDLRGRGVEV